MRILPDHMTRGDLTATPDAGVRTAIGFPLRVTVIGPAPFSILSRVSEQLVLNSVTLTDLFFRPINIRVLYRRPMVVSNSFKIRLYSSAQLVGCTKA